MSREAWRSFEGVYGYYAVKDPKPAARVYANFSDPNTSIDGDLPIYLTSHFALNWIDRIGIGSSRF